MSDTPSLAIVTQQFEMDSFRLNLRQALACLEDSAEDIKRMLRDTEHEDALSPDARWVDHTARLQKSIIALPSMCSVHHLGQIAHKLEIANASA